MLAGEKFALVIVTEILRRHYAVLHYDATFPVGTVLIKLGHHTLDKSGLVHLLAGALSTHATAESLVLSVDHLVGDIYPVVRNMYILVELDIEVGSHAYIEFQLEILLLGIEHVLLVGHGVAEHVDLILPDIVIDSVAYQFVYLVVFHSVAILLGDKTCGNMSRTETGFGMLLANLLELFLNVVGIILLFDINGYHTVVFVDLDVFYFHFLIICFL